MRDARVTLNVFALSFSSMAEAERLELEPATGLAPRPDRHPRMDQPLPLNLFGGGEPLPVNLVAVEDVRMPAPAGVEVQLDAFYVALLRFERVGSETELNY